MYTVYCILYSVFFIVYSVFCILYAVYCILYTGGPRLEAQSEEHGFSLTDKEQGEEMALVYTQDTRCATSEQFTVCSVQRTVYIVHFTLYSVQCTVYSVHCTLYTVYLPEAHTEPQQPPRAGDVGDPAHLLRLPEPLAVRLLKRTVYSVHFTVYCVLCTVYTVHCALYTV